MEASNNGEQSNKLLVGEVSKGERFLKGGETGIQACMMLPDKFIKEGQEIKITADDKITIDTLIRSGLPQDFKRKINNASRYELSLVGKSIDEEKKMMNSFLVPINDDPGKRDAQLFLRKILQNDGQEIMDMKISADNIYKVFMEDGKGDVELFIRRIACNENITSDEIEKNNDIVMNLGKSLYGENSAKVAELLINGIVNYRQDPNGFIESAQENINRWEFGDDIYKTLDSNSEKWKENNDYIIDKYVEDCEGILGDNSGLFASFLPILESLKGKNNFISEASRKIIIDKTMLAFERAITKVKASESKSRQLVEFAGLLDVFYEKKGKVSMSNFGGDAALKSRAEEYYNTRIELLKNILKSNGAEEIIIKDGEKFDPESMIASESTGDKWGSSGNVVDRVIMPGFEYAEEGGQPEILKKSLVRTVYEDRGGAGSQIEVEGKQSINERLNEVIGKYTKSDTVFVKDFLSVLEFLRDKDSTCIKDDYGSHVNEVLDTFGRVFELETSKSGAESVLNLFINRYRQFYVISNAYRKENVNNDASVYYGELLGVFESVFSKVGIEKVEIKEGFSFDSDIMEYGEKEVDDEKMVGKVLETTPLFNFEGRLLRKAVVVVGVRKGTNKDK